MLSKVDKKYLFITIGSVLVGSAALGIVIYFILKNKRKKMGTDSNYFSKYFTLDQLVSSSLAKKYNIANNPTQRDIENLSLLCKNVLDPLHEKFNGKFKITSGFRNIDLNNKIGGSKTSEHLTGQAADIVATGGVKNSDIFKYIRENLKYGQLIWEFGTSANPDWVHVSYNVDRMRQQDLRAYKEGGKSKIDKYFA